MYQVYLGLTPLGPTEKISSFHTISKVSQIDYCMANQLYTEIFFQLHGNVLGEFSGVRPLPNDTIIAYLQVSLNFSSAH